MPTDIDGKDLRSQKFRKDLNNAMMSLLERINFRKITVKDICEESLISRATFYMHFTDKYVFLKWWMFNFLKENKIDKKDELKEEKINALIYDNKKILKNLIVDADSWTLDVFSEVLHSIFNLNIDKTKNGSPDPKYVVLSNFYIGGLLQYFVWQVNNHFPEEVKAMNEYFTKIIKFFLDFNSEDL